mgnify:FL=1
MLAAEGHAGKNVGNEEYLTIEEACILADTSRTTVSKWLRKGHISAVKTGGCVRIPRQEFEGWLKETRNT